MVPTRHSKPAPDGFGDLQNGTAFISQITIAGEMRSADSESANAYPATLKNIIDDGGYLPDQIYNADETGVYYKMLPDKTLASKDDEHKKEGFKSIKERMALLFAVNKTKATLYRKVLPASLLPPL